MIKDQNLETTYFVRKTCVTTQEIIALVTSSALSKTAMFELRMTRSQLRNKSVNIIGVSKLKMIRGMSLEAILRGLLTNSMQILCRLAVMVLSEMNSSGASYSIVR